MRILRTKLMRFGGALSCAGSASQALLAASVSVAIVVLSASVDVWAEPAESVWPEMSAAARQIGGGEKDVAVIVAIEKYAFVPSIPGARRNAKAWYDYFAKTRKARIENLTFVADADAALEGIRDAATKAARDVREGGCLWFVFIGHGAPSKDGKDGALIGVDAQQRANSIYARSLPLKELLAILQNSKAAGIRVIIDACFSGRTRTGDAIVPSLQPLVVTQAGPRDDPRTVLLTAARSDQYAGPLPGAVRPAYSYLLLGALRGWADTGGEGRLTAENVHRYAAGALQALLSDRNQTPTLLGDGSIVMAASPREAGPDLSAIAKRIADLGSPEDGGPGSGDSAPKRPQRIILFLDRGASGISRADYVAAKSMAEAMQARGVNVIASSALGQAIAAKLGQRLSQDGRLGAMRGELSRSGDYLVWGSFETSPGASGVEGMQSCLAAGTFHIEALKGRQRYEPLNLEQVKGFGLTQEGACRKAVANMGREIGSGCAGMLGLHQE